MKHLKIDNLCPTSDALVLVCDEPLPLEQLEAEADEWDLRAVEGISAAARRRERLMWRRIVRETTGQQVEVEYSPSGAPRIKNFPFEHISVSHCRGVVAVVASHRECGVDVERKDRNFERVASRYVSEQEWALCRERGCEREAFLAVVWCAKECMYKVAQREGVSLRDDISVEDIDLAAGVVVGRVAGGDAIRMHIVDCKEYLMLYCIK